MAATSPRDNATAARMDALPPAMQEDILCRLPIRDAARTSVLSRAWRRRWEPVAYRFLDWPLGVPGDTVDGVLSRCASPVHEFRHPYVPKTDFDRSDQWLLRLAAVGVRSISFEFERQDFLELEADVLVPQRIHMLHPCIFSCRELATLDLVGCDIPAPPPGFAGLPSLTTLSLSKVGFPQGVRGLEALISSSPLLQVLQLEGLNIPTVEVDGIRVFEQWVISAPNLQRLRIISCYDYGWHFSGLPFLEVADISGLDSRYYDDDRDFLILISALDQARELKLSMLFTWNDVLEGPSPSFENLKSLSLQTQFSFPASILSILSVVRNAPELEVLDIEVTDYVNKAWQGVGIDFLNAQCADDLFSNLITIRMKDAICECCEMLFIELVLYKATQLEVLDVCLSIDCSRSVEAVMAEVAQYGRASPGANVIISSRHHD